MITTPKLALIDKTDSSELVRDQIAAILTLETANQVKAAGVAGKQAELWDLRVFTERSQPWGMFQNPPSGDEEDPTFDPTPIVDVLYGGTTFDKSMGDVIERQQGSALYNIDCYGFGVSRSNGPGHLSGDEVAAFEAQRAARLVRNILMAGGYTYLALRTPNQGPVAGRWIQSITPFAPLMTERAIQDVQAVRIVLEVNLVELSPQVETVTLEAIGLSLKRKETGQVYLAATYLTPEQES